MFASRLVIAVFIVSSVAPLACGGGDDSTGEDSAEVGSVTGESDDSSSGDDADDAVTGGAGADSSSSDDAADESSPSETADDSMSGETSSGETSSGETSAGDDSSDASGSESEGDDAAADAAGSTLEACSADGQPETRDESSMCHSPFYNTELRTNSDVLGCDCVECEHEETCIDGIQYFCRGTWFDKEVGSCDAPNACVEIWLKSFQSDEIDDCERLAGGFIIGDDPDAPVSCRIELTFTNNLSESRGAAGSRTGQYRCDGMNVVGTFGPAIINGSYDPASGVLTWDGMEMQEIPNDFR